MSTASYLNRFLAPVTDAFTPETARQFADLHADSELHAHVDDLARKANDGTITPDDHAPGGCRVQGSHRRCRSDCGFAIESSSFFEEILDVTWMTLPVILSASVRVIDASIAYCHKKQAHY